MTRSSLSLCKRILAPIQSASILLLLLILSGLGNYLSAAALQAGAQGPKIWLQDNRSLGVHHTGPAAAGVAASQPVSMASGDIDGDGVPDLVVGHKSANGGFISIYHGNLDAFAPQSDASLQAIGRGEFPSPFLPDAQTFSVPVTPDFLALGNFTGDGQRDLILAARGSNTL
ncbi:MAG TPA: VCBS repeat-containing protein, partial [Candidatus Angelobacter sp.]